jgi:hypothetical protein
VTFDGYSVNGNAVAGTITTTAKIDRSALAKECTVKAENLTVTFTNGEVHTTALATHVRTWNLTAGTITDTGNATGTTRNGNAFTASITTPVVRKKDCFDSGMPHPVSGVKQLEVASKSTCRIDFGSGACDNLATVYVGDQSKQITLGRR